jgi:hypothetical protein
MGLYFGLISKSCVLRAQTADVARKATPFRIM